MDYEEILHSGMIYHLGEENLAKEQLRRLDMLFEYNALKPSQQAEKTALLKEMFAEIGENVYIETPFHSNFGGMNVHFGHMIYANFNLTLVDDTHIYVGSYTMFGPNVTVATASHPISPEHRKQDYQYNQPVHIGENCWIGAGSVVTKDIPANVVAVGNPCRVLREINDDDRNLISHGRQMEIAEQ
jgi:galactoside O-acetyltransferase